MIFSVVCKAAPCAVRASRSVKCLPGLSMCFYDAVSIQREFGPYGLKQFGLIDETSPGGALSFINVVCQRAGRHTAPARTASDHSER